MPGICWQCCCAHLHSLQQHMSLNVYGVCECCGSMCRTRQLAPDTVPGACAAAVMLPHVLQHAFVMHALRRACCGSLCSRLNGSSAWLRDCRCIPVLALVAAEICCCCVHCGEELLLGHISGPGSCCNSAASVIACRNSLLISSSNCSPVK
jgi:hypothetical protein